MELKYQKIMAIRTLKIGKKKGKKMNTKKFFSLVGCFLIIIGLIGCSKKNQEINNNLKDNVIAEMVQKTVSALDSKNSDNIESLFFLPAIQDKGKHDLNHSEIERFLSTYSGSKRILFNDGSLISGSYSLNGKKYRTYSSVVALVETKDNLYSLNFYFCDAKNKNEDDGLIALQIVTAKSEAYCNAYLEDEYIKNNEESFSYIDYNDNAYDSISSEYRTIMSEILCYDKNATVITKEEADKTIVPDITTKAQIISQYGNPAAIYTDVGDIIYYQTNIDGKYLMITFYNGEKERIVRRYDIVGELYPHWEQL